MSQNSNEFSSPLLDPLVDVYIGTEAVPTKAPRTNIIRDVCVFVLVMELAERLCFYTFSGSIVIYLRDNLGYSQVSLARTFTFHEKH